MGKQELRFMPKLKGLQKLRWYCQMCQKQCRDQNGFDCHCTSQSHLRQMEIFGQNPRYVIDRYSEQFETSFLEHMKWSHRSSSVAATVVYNEYIADRYHIHMNSTRWATLTDFVTYLGRTGKCKIEDTSRGLFMTYIDRDSETFLKGKMQKNKRARADIEDDERQERDIQRQIMLAGKVMTTSPIEDKIDSTKLFMKPKGDEKIKFTLLTRVRRSSMYSNKIAYCKA